MKDDRLGSEEGVWMVREIVCEVLVYVWLCLVVCWERGSNYAVSHVVIDVVFWWALAVLKKELANFVGIFRFGRLNSGL